MNYFIIPGNPPAIHFYELWKNEIETTFPKANVKICHYPLLAKSSDSQLYFQWVFSSHLQQLIEFHQTSRDPITIIGHSIGAYFALKLLEEFENEIKDVILLYPFLRQPGLKGKLVLNMGKVIHSSNILQRFVIKNRKFLDFFSKDLSLVTNDELEKTFHIAKHEWNVVGLDDSPLLFKEEHRHKLRIYHHPRDTWCSSSFISTLREQVSLIECGEEHGFITNEKQRQSLLAKLVLGSIDN